VTTPPVNVTSTGTCAAGTGIACAASASVMHPGLVTPASAKKINPNVNHLTHQVRMFLILEPFKSTLPHVAYDQLDLANDFVSKQL